MRQEHAVLIVAGRVGKKNGVLKHRIVRFAYGEECSLKTKISCFEL